jgi:hypothetical protein
MSDNLQTGEGGGAGAKSCNTLLLNICRRVLADWTFSSALQGENSGTSFRNLTCLNRVYFQEIGTMWEANFAPLNRTR